MVSSAAKVVPASRCERPAPAPLWTRNFVAGTFLNFFIAGNYFMLMVVMTAYALTVHQAPAAVAAFCASAFIVGTLFSRFAAAPMMERFGRMPLLVAGCIAEVALSALYLLNEPVGALIGVRLAHGFSYGVCSPTIATVEHSPLARFVEAGVLPISVVCGLLFFGYSSLLTFLTPYATEIGLARAASVFFVVYALAMFVTRPFTGRAFDRVGPHPVMVPAFVSFALGMVVLAFAANDWMILGAAALLGFGVGTVQSCGLAMAVRVTSDARLSVANATFYMLLDVGVGVGPILLGIVAPLIGYANLYLCMAVVGALALALFLVVAKTEKGAR